MMMSGAILRDGDGDDTCGQSDDDEAGNEGEEDDIIYDVAADDENAIK